MVVPGSTVRALRCRREGRVLVAQGASARCPGGPVGGPAGQDERLEPAVAALAAWPNFAAALAEDACPWQDRQHGPPSAKIRARVPMERELMRRRDPSRPGHPARTPV